MAGRANRQKLRSGHQLLQQQYPAQHSGASGHRQSSGCGCPGTFGANETIERIFYVFNLEFASLIKWQN